MRILRPLAIHLLAASSLLLAGPASAQKDKKAPDEAAAQEEHPLTPTPHMIEVGGWLGLMFPSSRHELYDPTVARHQALGSVAADFGLRAAYFPVKYFGLELEGGLAPASTKDTSESALLWTFRGHLVGQYPIGAFVPFAVLGFGTLGVSSDDAVLGKDNDGAFHWGLGAKYYINRLLAIRLDGRHISTGGVDDAGDPNSNPRANHFELLAGLSFTLNRSGEADPDPDNDGIRGDQDKCPNKAGVPPDGCPAKDSDGDGVMDHKDACPIDPGDGADGCPLEDSDGDGVPDRDDKCPTDPARTPSGCPDPDPDKDGIESDRDQCPLEAGPEPHGCPDSDRDGVPNHEDQCKDVAGVPPNGCPAQDTDEDGINDDQDQCPAQAETKNGYQDGDGCPDEVPQEIAKFTGAIQGIQFKSGSAEILKTSFGVLNKAAQILKDYPELRIEVQGHTDSSGSDELNLEVSQKRADSVKAYLVAQGVEPNRIEAKGYGETTPVADNNTPAGKAKNRRIEFKLLE